MGLGLECTADMVEAEIEGLQWVHAVAEQFGVEHYYIAEVHLLSEVFVA